MYVAKSVLKASAIELRVVHLGKLYAWRYTCCGLSVVQEPALPDSVIVALNMQLAVVAICAYLFGAFAQRFRLPSVVGELLVGVVLGPSILRRLLPEAYQFIGPEGLKQITLVAISSLAVILLLFSAGIECEFQLMRSVWRPALRISLAGFFVPFVFGFLPAYFFPELLGRQAGVNPIIFATFVGAVLSITALSVLVKMLMDLDIYRSKFGMMMVTAAVCGNLLSWTLVGGVFAFVGKAAVSSVKRPDPLLTLACSLLFAIIMVTLGRFAFNPLLKKLEHLCSSRSSMTAIILGLGALAASFTRSIGLDGLFGAFIAGATIGAANLTEDTRKSIRQFVSNFLAPVYFAFLGMRTDFIANFNWTLVPVILILACSSKILGCFLAARIGKLPLATSLSAGLLMNSRGAMGVIVAAMGLETQIIDERMFVALAIMSVLTSIIAGLFLGPKVESLSAESCITAEAT